jgi:hypothetical protein
MSKFDIRVAYSGWHHALGDLCKHTSKLKHIQHLE